MHGTVGVAPANLEVVTADQWRAWCRSARISDALALWATGSGGTNPDVLALQETAADLGHVEDGVATHLAGRATPQHAQLPNIET